MFTQTQTQCKGGVDGAPFLGIRLKNTFCNELFYSVNLT